MKSTARDFWKMVTDRKCRVIVMLSGLVEGGEVRNTATLSSTSERVLVGISRRYATSTGPAVAHKSLESSKWMSWRRRGCRALYSGL